MRLDKFLAESDVGTRKIVRDYIKKGLVTVNKELILETAFEVTPNLDVVTFRGDNVTYQGKVYYMFHKPEGCITARKDDEHRTVLDYFPKENTKGLFPVGRLDKDTEGLLFLTNDGDFDYKMMNPEHEVDKTYVFWALGVISKEEQSKLEQGVVIGKDGTKTKPAVLKIRKAGIYEEYMEDMKIVHSHDMSLKRYDQPVIMGELTISEGRKHQVKRMLRAIGCYVVYLKRISIGSVMLDETLEKGKYRELTQKEVEALIHGN